MVIKTKDAIETARGYIGTPYSEMDCIRLIVMIIRNSPGGVKDYRCQGTNWLWDSVNNSGKYRHLTSREEGLSGAQAGKLAFKRSGDNIHHVGMVTEQGTVIHSSSVRSCVVETELDGSWDLLGTHRYIEVADGAAESEVETVAEYKMRVQLIDQTSYVNVRKGPSLKNDRIGRLMHGDVVTVKAESDGWAFISYDGGIGYVSSEYLIAYEETTSAVSNAITIIDSAGNRFMPVGDWRVLIGSVD